MKRIFITIALLFLVTGCVTTEEDYKAYKEAQTTYKESYKFYTQHSEVARIELTEDGRVKAMIIGNQNLKAPTMPRMPESTTAVAIRELGMTSRTLITSAASTAGYVAGAKIAGDSFAALSAIANTGSTVVNTTTTTGSHNSQSSQSEVTETATATTTTTTTTSTENSHNVQTTDGSNNPVDTQTTTTTTDNTNNSDSSTASSTTNTPVVPEDADDGDGS